MPKGQYDRSKAKPNRGMFKQAHSVWNRGWKMTDRGYPNFGENIGRKRGTMSSTHRLKLSLAHKGWQPSEEHRQRFIAHVLPLSKTPTAIEKMARSRLGRSNPAWRGGERRPKHNGELRYRQWREAVFVRDDYTCQSCGGRGGQLNADHILPWSTHPDLRYHLSNGRTLCVPCHKQTPTYGRRTLRAARTVALQTERHHLRAL